MIARWFRSKAASEGEQLGADVREVLLRCREYEPRGSGSLAVADGVTGKDWSLALRTAQKEAAEVAENDAVEWRGYRYLVQRTASLRSSAFLGAREYVIYLK